MRTFKTLRMNSHPALRMHALSALLIAALSTTVHATGNHTGAQFAVTESGAATLSVPIQVPRGIGGMEPQLSLNYSTGAGNGLLGLGWTLSGPSAITRCAKTILHDGARGAVTFGTGDRFCLDGQRLIPSSRANTDAEYGLPGTEYRTDKDTFSRITAVGTGANSPSAPASFKVETKSGLIMYFGSSGASQVPVNDPALGTARPINRWMLDRIEDRNGSFVKFEYCAGEVSAASECQTNLWQGSTVLQYIQYTNRPGKRTSQNPYGPVPPVMGTSAVLFVYEGRPDKVPQFHYGAKTVQTQRMSRIETYVGFASPSSIGTRVRQYTLSYEQNTSTNPRATTASRLIAIQESNGTGADDKLPPLELTYTRDLVLGKGFVASALTDGLPDPSCGGTRGVRTAQAMCP
jgi:Salmonella virulence plasmid 65kDa B protein